MDANLVVKDDECN